MSQLFTSLLTVFIQIWGVFVTPVLNRGPLGFSVKLYGPRIKCGVAVLLLALLPLSAHAARFSGQYLLHICASDQNGNEITPGGHIACQAYIAGILDYHNLIRSLGTAPSVDFCVPDGVSMNTLQKQTQSYVLRNRVQHDRFVAAPGVALGLYAFYPCR